MTTKQSRVIVVDDHPIVRQGLTQMINRDGDLIVCGEAEEARSALQAIATLSPDIVVIDISEARDDLRVFVNPVIVAAEGEAECEEGCLSVPGYYERVRRAARVFVRAQDAKGKPFELEADGMLAVCIQHETEHLEGKIFVDHLSALKRSRLAARLRKKQRLAG